MKNKERLRQWILSGVLIPLLAFGIWSGIQVHDNSTRRAAMKDDFSQANSIIFGVFSANKWRDEVKKILTQQINEFELTAEQDSLLRVQVHQTLDKLITQAKAMVEERDESLKNKIRKWAVDIFVDWGELRQQVPQFTESIMEEIHKRDTREDLKSIARQKVDEYANKIQDDSLQTFRESIFAKYDVADTPELNAHLKPRVKQLQETTYNHTYWMLGLIGIFILPWFITGKYPELKTPLFLLSVALAMIVLITGLTSPMIEIDARIKRIDFTLIDREIVFQDQMLFYRSKSILQVVGLLLQSARIDSKLVGVLVLAFSVILPISKLLSTGIKLLGLGKLSRNKVVEWLAFRSGKWSMADVLVVAIFMAYVSFDGILDEQLKMMDRDSQLLTSITTNLTSLEPGFILFFAFVLFGLTLAQILKWITKK